jgi:Flp pilus assembly secretin CpaC
MNRIAYVMLVWATLSVSVVAQEPKSPAPIPTIPPVAPMPLAGMKWVGHDHKVSQATSEKTKPTPPSSATMFQVQVTLMKVPAGFRNTFHAFEPSSTEHAPLVLSDREMKLVMTTLAATKSCETLSRPMLLLASGQKGFVQVGQQFPVLGPVTQTQANGETVYQAKPVMVPVGLEMNVTATEVNAKEFTFSVRAKNVDISSSVVPAKGTEAKLGEVDLPVAIAFDWQNRTIDSDIASLLKRSTIEITQTLKLKHGQAVMLSGGSENRDQELIAVLQTRVVANEPPQK